jgi:hypothetical protein
MPIKGTTFFKEEMMPEKVLQDRTKIVSIKSVPLIQYIQEEELKDKIIKIECPECGHFIDIDHIKCGCDVPKDVNIFKGCRECGMKIGKGAFRVRAVACVSCGYELDFFEPYPVSKGSFQLRKEDDDFLSISYFLSIGVIGFIIFILLLVFSCWLDKGKGYTDAQVQYKGYVNQDQAEDQSEDTDVQEEDIQEEVQPGTRIFYAPLDNQVYTEREKTLTYDLTPSHSRVINSKPSISNTDYQQKLLGKTREDLINGWVGRY